MIISDTHQNHYHYHLKNLHNYYLLNTALDRLGVTWPVWHLHWLWKEAPDLSSGEGCSERRLEHSIFPGDQLSDLGGLCVDVGGLPGPDGIVPNLGLFISRPPYHDNLVDTKPPFFFITRAEASLDDGLTVGKPCGPLDGGQDQVNHGFLLGLQLLQLIQDMLWALDPGMLHLNW